MMAQYEETLAQGPVSYQTQFLDTRFGKTHVVFGGTENNSPVILFHGWNGNAAGIGAEFPFLFDHFCVYMPDIIGHPGKSAAIRPSTTGSNYADWAADVMDGLALDNAIVMGPSGGGWLALKTAAYCPQRVTKVIAVNPDGLARLRLRKMWPAIPAMLRKNQHSIKRLVQVWAAAPDTNDPIVQDFADGILQSMQHFKTQNNPGLIPDDELQRITAPTCLLIGEEDLFNPQKGLARAQKLIPGIHVARILPRTGHILLEKPRELVKSELLSFLEEESTS